MDEQLLAAEVTLNMLRNEIIDRVPDDAEVTVLGDYDSEPYLSDGPRTRAIAVSFADGGGHRVIIPGSLIDDGAHPRDVALALSGADVAELLRRTNVVIFRRGGELIVEPMTRPF